MKIRQEEIDAAREAYCNDGKYNWDRAIRAALTVRKRLKAERNTAKRADALCESAFKFADEIAKEVSRKSSKWDGQHYDAERGVFDFETPDGVYVFQKGKE